MLPISSNLKNAIAAVDMTEYAKLTTTEKEIVNAAQATLDAIEKTTESTQQQTDAFQNEVYGDFATLNTSDGKHLTGEFISDIQKLILASWASNYPAEKNITKKDENADGNDDRLQDHNILKYYQSRSHDTTTISHGSL